MPTLSGIRRRGFTPGALRALCAAVGASRTNGSTDIEMLEHFQRDDLNHRANRAMAVLRPLKVVIDNYPEGQEEFVEVANNPEDPSPGRAWFLSPGRFTSSRTTSGRCLRRNISGCRPEGGPPAQCLFRDRAKRGEGGRRQSRRGALHVRFGQPCGNSPDGRKVKGRCTGFRRRTRLRPRFGLRQAVLQSRSF